MPPHEETPPRAPRDSDAGDTTAAADPGDTGAGDTASGDSDTPGTSPGAATATTPGTSAGLGRYPWIAMAVVLVGSYMVILDTTVLGVALAEIASDLDAVDAVLGVDWVVTSYLVAVGAVHTMAGWLADRFGKRRVYLAALVAFAVGSLVSALAPTLPALVAARVLQGAGGGALMPVGMAMVYELFPPDRRGTALGIWGIAVMAAPALGPPLGGWLTTAVSWRLIFLVNVPIGALALTLGVKLLRDLGFREHRPFDYRGFVLAVAGVAAVVIASRQASDWGVTAPQTWLVLGMGLVFVGVFVRRALRIPNPLIDVRIFAVPTFAISAGVVALVGVSQFARLTFLPVELQVVRDLEASRVGLLLAPSAIGVATTMSLGGWLADRVGARGPVVVGVAMTASATFFLTRLTPTTPESTIVTILFASGVGTGLSIMPNVVAAMNSLPNRFVSQASALRALNRQLARAIGTAVLAAVVVARLGAVAPRPESPAEVAHAQAVYNDVFAIAVVMLVLGGLLALALPGRAGMRAMQEARQAEHDELVAASET